MPKAVKLTEKEMADLHARAIAAADQAFAGAKLTPVVFGQAKSLFSTKIDYSQQTFYEPDGVCGFAWVNVRPGTSRFARWLIRKGVARTDSYYRGVRIWAPGGDRMSQSYDRKMAAAEAYAAVLRESGITAYASGRLD